MGCFLVLIKHILMSWSAWLYFRSLIPSPYLNLTTSLLTCQDYGFICVFFLLVSSLYGFQYLLWIIKDLFLLSPAFLSPLLEGDCDIRTVTSVCFPSIPLLGLHSSGFASSLRLCQALLSPRLHLTSLFLRRHLLHLHCKKWLWF